MTLYLLGSGVVKGLSGPSFSAYATANQSLTTGTYTKVLLQAVDYNIGSCFDNTTNYRFQPTVAGDYLIEGTIRSSGTSLTVVLAEVWKNGASWKRGVEIPSAATQTSVSVIVSMNGTTDYVELYAVVSGTTPGLAYFSNTYTSWFQGCLIRAT